ncbi:hypothetical protein HID58_079654 [Brassica napus]|uniref:Zinc knuckle CX2CX4HX4C domain-containing protein n=1 Tax=Brassica napus TaxID=3708 RepID=A0ABQ7Y2M5_BRANA|nr:hypothetical protein HID58_079654 [Brassica napus]
MVNGMRPLEFHLDIELTSGELKNVELQYENLDKHCFSCKSLCHETKDCPSSLTLKERLSKPVGTNQAQTLNRIEVDRRRQDEKKLSTTYPSDTRDRGRVSDSIPYSSTRYEDTRRPPRGVDFRSYVKEPACYSNQSVTHQPSNSQTHSASLRPIPPTGSEGSRRQTRPEKESTRVWVEKAFQSVNTGPHSVQVSHTPSYTPSPRPVRELMNSPPPDGDDSTAAKTRKYALERLSLPATGNNLLQHGVSITNSESIRLQEVEIHYLEDTFRNQAVDSSSKPSSSRVPASERLSLPMPLSSVPIRTLSEDRLHVSLRLGGLPVSDPVEDVPPMAAQKKKRGRPPSSSKAQAIPKAPSKEATKKPTSTKRALWWLRHNGCLVSK